MAKVNGQSKLAEQAIHALTQRDPAFLHSLVEPYLNGIIAHAIDRTRKQTGIKEPVTSRVSAPMQAAPKAASPAAVKKPVKPAPEPVMSGNSLDGLMQAWAKGFDRNTSGDKAPETKPGKVSQSHLDALKAMAVKTTGKKI